MDLGLSGKTAIVTGSSAGIGFASAKALYSEGVNVIMVARDAQRLAASAKAVSDSPSLVQAKVIDEAESESTRSIPLGQMVDPSEIAAMTLFLVSDRAASITGAEILIDGGQTPSI